MNRLLFWVLCAEALTRGARSCFVRLQRGYNPGGATRETAVNASLAESRIRIERRIPSLSHCLSPPTAARRGLRAPHDVAAFLSESHSGNPPQKPAKSSHSICYSKNRDTFHPEEPKHNKPPLRWLF